MTREHPANTLPSGKTALVRRGAVLVHAHHWSGEWFVSDSGKAMDGAPDAWIEIADDLQPRRAPLCRDRNPARGETFSCVPERGAIET